MKSRRRMTLLLASLSQLTLALLLLLTGLASHQQAAAAELLGITPTATSSPPTETPVPPTPSATVPPPTEPTPVPPEQPAPHLTIEKTTAATTVSPGADVSFHIRVCNIGDATAENVIVSDALPAEMTLVSASASQGVVVTDGNGVRAELGALAAGACAQVNVAARVAIDVAPGTQIRNVGSVGEIYDEATVTIIALLPQSGQRALPSTQPLLLAALFASAVICLLVAARRER